MSSQWAARGNDFVLESRLIYWTEVNILPRAEPAQPDWGNPGELCLWHTFCQILIAFWNSSTWWVYRYSKLQRPLKRTQSSWSDVNRRALMLLTTDVPDLVADTPGGSPQHEPLVGAATWPVRLHAQRLLVLIQFPLPKISRLVNTKSKNNVKSCHFLRRLVYTQIIPTVKSPPFCQVHNNLKESWKYLP